MQNTNIVNLLKTFSKKELNEFEAYIKSPIQIRKRDVTSFLKAIKNFNFLNCVKLVMSSFQNTKNDVLFRIKKQLEN